MDTIEIIFSIFLGVGLSAAVGFRVFLPLLLLSLTAYFEYIPLNENWVWLGSLTAVITLTIATFIEIFGYFIPWLDNLLDTVAIPLAAVAGTLIMMSTLADFNPIITWSLAIIAGGGTAATIKGNTSALRLTSTATTAGIANPAIAVAETATASFMSILSFIFAPLAFLLVLTIFYFIYRFYKKLRAK